MTAKHFEAVARALRSTRHLKSGTSIRLWEITVEKLADTLLDTNPLFDRARFLTACGYMEGQ